MIIELDKESFSKVLTLYQSSAIFFPLILAVVQAKQQGRIFCDALDIPRSALVVTKFGFMSVFGADENGEFNFQIAKLLATRGALGQSYLLWYAPPASWQKKLDFLVPAFVRRRERIRFEFPHDYAGFLSKVVHCPDGYELRNLDSDLISRTGKLGANIESRFWSSAADFNEHGLGTCLVKDGQVISLCYSACVVDHTAEIDIVTEPAYRGLGLGMIVAQQFIIECVNRGITPTWDSFESNYASIRLAEKLGFVGFNKYPLYSFNVPLVLANAPREGANEMD